MDYHDDIDFDELEYYGIDLTQPTQTEEYRKESLASNGRKKPRPCHHNKWTQEEDDALRQLVAELGDRDWKNISKRLDERRNPRQCRERWQYYLNPNLNHGNWTKEEDELLFQKREELGAKWTLIAKFFVNRTDAMIKTRYNQLDREMKKKKGNDSENNNVQNNLQAPLAQGIPHIQQPFYQAEVFPDFTDNYFEEDQYFSFDYSGINYF